MLRDLPQIPQILLLSPAACPVPFTGLGGGRGKPPAMGVGIAWLSDFVKSVQSGNDELSFIFLSKYNTE